MYTLLKDKLLFLFLIVISPYINADVKTNGLNNLDSEIVYELTDLDQIRDALAEYSRAEDENNALYEQKRRAMLDSVEIRFLACDTDADDTLDVFEVTQCLPQVARRFRDVDIDNDNVITLDEIAILAKNYEKRVKELSKENLAAEEKKSDPAAFKQEPKTNKEI